MPNGEKNTSHRIAENGAHHGLARTTSGEVVVVDADPYSLLVTTQILRGGGFRVWGARDRGSGQDHIRAQSPGVVILDLDLPGNGAFALCEWLKADSAFSTIPVVFLYGDKASDRKGEAVRLGGADFIGKPIDAEELLLRVTLHLQLHEQQRALLQSLVDREEAVEAQLRRYNSELLKLQAAVEQSPSSVVITDRAGHIEYVNHKFEEVSGYSLQEVRGKTPRILRAPDTPPKVYEEMWTTILTGRIWRGILHNRQKSGRLFWERTFIAPVYADGSGEITHFIAVKEDITAQREIEAQLQQAQKLEAIGRLAAGIAHEINTPTQFISDNLHFLQEAFASLLEVMDVYRRCIAILAGQPEHAALAAEARNTEQRCDLAYVLENAPLAFSTSLDGVKRVSSIVLAMKEFSHPDQIEMEPVDLNASIENTLIISRTEYKYVADVEKSLGEIPEVMCHPGDVCQAILNIVVNAAHAIADARGNSGERGTIRIRTALDGDCVRIEIEDNGTGIPADAREHVFEPFFTTKEVGNGTGQGLAIAHASIVQKHRGALTFVTEMGKGTTFTIRLPIRGAEGAT